MASHGRKQPTPRDVAMPILNPTVPKTLSALAELFDVFVRISAPVRGGRQARFTFLSAIILIFTLSASAAEKVTPIREMLRDNDANYVPDRLGETFTVSGVMGASICAGARSRNGGFQTAEPTMVGKARCAVRTYVRKGG